MVRSAACLWLACCAGALCLSAPARASEDPLGELLAQPTLEDLSQSIRSRSAPLPRESIPASALPSPRAEDSPAAAPPQGGKDEPAIRLRPAERVIARPSDGGIVFSSGLPVNIVGFWGYGGSEKGEGYRFIGTGYEGVSGTSRVLPVSLTLAGLTADPRQNIYSAELRAEAPIAFSRALEVVPYAGFRAVRTQEADQQSDRAGSGGHALNQLPAGIGVRVTGPAESETQVALRGQVGAVANLGSAGTMLVVPGARSDDRSSLTGIGSVGIELQRGSWNFGAGADIGVSSDDKTEKGFSVNVRHEF